MPEATELSVPWAALACAGPGRSLARRGYPTFSARAVRPLANGPHAPYIIPATASTYQTSEARRPSKGPRMMYIIPCNAKGRRRQPTPNTKPQTPKPPEDTRKSHTQFVDFQGPPKALRNPRGLPRGASQRAPLPTRMIYTSTIRSKETLNPQR